MHSRLRRAQIWPLLLFALVGVVLLSVGLFLGWRQNQVITAWPQVQATVTGSRIIMKSPSSYSAEITFRYRADGQEHTTTVSPGYETAVREIMQSKIKNFAPGSQHTVRVDPANAENIEFNAGYSAEFFMLPLVLSLTGVLFLAIGLVPALYERTAQRKAISPPSVASALETADKMPQFVGGIFAAIGVLLLAVALWMGANLQSRKQWPQTQATVSRSRILSYSSGGSASRAATTLHAIEIEFQYDVNGKKYVAPVMALTGTRERARLEPVLPQFAKGSQHSIYYNPADPSAITFESEGKLWVLIIGGMGAAFLGMGLLCVLVFRNSSLPVKP